MYISIQNMDCTFPELTNANQPLGKSWCLISRSVGFDAGSIQKISRGLPINKSKDESSLSP